MEAKLCSVSLIVDKYGNILTERVGVPPEDLRKLLTDGDPVLEVMEYTLGRIEELTRDLHSRYGVMEIEQ